MLRIPEQFSVNGFDDAPWPTAWPALSTIRQPVQEMGIPLADLENITR